MNDEAEESLVDPTALPLWAELDAARRQSETNPGVYLDKYGRLMATPAARIDTRSRTTKTRQSNDNSPPSLLLPDPDQRSVVSLSPSATSSALEAVGAGTSEFDDVGAIGRRARSNAEASNWLLGVAAVNSFMTAKSFFQYFTVVRASHQIARLFASLNAQQTAHRDSYIPQIAFAAALSVVVSGVFWALWRKSTRNPSLAILHGGRVLLAISSLATAAGFLGSVGISEKATMAFAFAVNVGGFVAVHRTLTSTAK